MLRLEWHSPKRSRSATRVGGFVTPHFALHELSCRHCGACEMDEGFLFHLEELRTQHYGRVMPLGSGYRCPEFNRSVSVTGPVGPHTTGQAVDVRIFGAAAHELLEAALTQGGWTGIGIGQRGPVTDRFIHLDRLTNTSTRPRPWVWTY